MDLNGLADPYVKLRLQEKSFQSQTKYKTLAPEWEETFELSLDPDELFLSVQVRHTACGAAAPRATVRRFSTPAATALHRCGTRTL